MLSGETAYGKFPIKAVQVMASVAKTTEDAMKAYRGGRRFGTDESEAIDWIQSPTDDDGQLTMSGITEMYAYHCTSMGNTLRAPIVAFSKRGRLPALLSHYRPNSLCYVFTDSNIIQRRLSLAHGIVATHMHFEDDAEETIGKALNILVDEGRCAPDENVLIVRGGPKPIWPQRATHAIQVRKTPRTDEGGDSEGEGQGGGRFN